MNKQNKYVRSGISATVIATCFVFCVIGNELSAHGETKSSPDAVIYSGTYPGWPWIERAPSGKLLCVWREGVRHSYSSNGKMMLSTSTDDGKTWSTAKTIEDAPNLDDRGGGIVALSDSEWLVSYFRSDSSMINQVMTVRTTDSGKTWSDPKPVNGKTTLNHATRSAPVELSSGELVLPYYSVNNPSGSPLAAVSSDKGNTWTTYTVPNAPGLTGNEWCVVEMPDKTLAGIIRNGYPGSDGSFYITKSSDKGHTWSTPAKTNLEDVGRYHSPAQLFVHKDKLWALYDDERYVSVALATTDDPNLLDWNVDERIEAYQYKPDGSSIYDGGYTCSVSVGGNKRLIVDYVNDGGTHQIVGYYATMPLPEPGALSMLSAVGALAAGTYFWRNRRR